MSAALATKDRQATRDSRRRKQNRTGGRHAPEPKNMVSGTGRHST